MTGSQIEEVDNEANLLARVRHPNIVSCIENIEVANTMYIVQEYCANGDLAHLLENLKDQQQLLPEERVLSLFSQVCFGLLSLHQRRIFHRDIKLDNIFLTADDVPKIGDLGISKAMDRTNQRENTSN